MKIALYLKSELDDNDIEVIKTVFNDFEMDKVVIVPSMKNCSSEREFNHLVFQIFFKLRENDLAHDVKISTIELKLIPPYHRYAIWHALKNNYCNDKVFILCTEDSIKEISDWTNGEMILKEFEFLIV